MNLNLLTTLPLVATLAAAIALGAGSLGRGSLPDAELPAPALGGQPSGTGLLAAAEITNASATIDKLIADQQQKLGLKPNPRTTDEQFLRRAYLDLVGRIPTLEESVAFFSSQRADKRQALVKSLIGSEGYISHQFTFWADLLRATTRLQDRYPGQSYVDWIKQSLRENKPYDKMVTELLCSEGPALARGNGATGYYVRDFGMPLDNMSNTVQIFLGTQLACAQCHNHPNDKWTRKDYYAMAAFTNSTEVKKGYKADKSAMKPGERMEMAELAKKIRNDPPEVRNAFRRLTETVGLSVNSADKSAMKLPHDYQYADAKPNEMVQAHVMFGDTPAVGAKQDPREVYAAWMTSANNPRFATVVANRLWKKAMGIGLVEPVDNFKDDTVASNPALMDFLTKLMVSVKFDLRKFQEAIYTTDAWQRQVMAKDVNAGDEGYAFQGPVLRRLTAEQLWDSLMTLAVPDLDTQKGATSESQIEMYEKNKEMTPTQMYELAKGMSTHREEAQALRKDFERLKGEIEKAANPEEKRKLFAQMKELGERRKELEAKADPSMAMAVKKKEGQRDGRMGSMLRASELLQPAPNGHFLRMYGQSDRQLIENATPAPAVTQALALMNGLVDGDILSNRSLLSANLLKGTSPDAKVKILWQTILARQPTAEELSFATREIVKGSKEEWNDLAWALINSSEFLFLR